MSRSQDANANEQKQTISKMETIETMSNNKQSSVDWLISQLQISTYWKYLIMEVELMECGEIDIIEQAKAMHKEECIKYYVDSVDYGDMGQHIRESLIQIAEKMYNETFGE